MQPDLESEQLKEQMPQPSKVNIFWLFGRINCLDKICESRNVSMVA
jgi:hypothetical protein